MGDTTLTKLIWRVTGVSVGRTSCESCGHDIANLYHLRAPTGETMIVGSECVKSLAESVDIDFDIKIERRLNRAARQWRDNNPPRKTDETREQYINRRLSEMGNAWAGFKLCVKLDFMKVQAVAEVEHAAELAALKAKITSQYSAEFDAYVAALRSIDAEAVNKAHSAIEAATGANRFDYNQPAYKVRKI
jgi:hypothetical protein